MKTFKKVLASTLAAAMVVTALPVTPANAAAAPKLSATKATLYVGQSKAIKVTTPKAWKSVKVKATTSKKSVATVKTSKKKVTVKAVKAGTAKVTVKVTGKKSGKAVKKTLKATITVKNPALTLKAADVVAVGATEQITATVKPAGTKVTYTTSDATIATVDEKGVVTGVKDGEVTITAKAGKTTKTVKMTVKKYVVKSVKQTKADTFEAVVLGKTADIKAADITVTNKATNATYAVKAVAVDAKDATKVIFSTFAELTDGATYVVTIAGTAVEVPVTDGKVADVTVSPVQIPANTEGTEIKAQTIDKDGVVLKEFTTTTDKPSNVDFTLSTTQGYVSGAKLVLPVVGNKGTAEVTYHTYKYDANAKEEGAITKKVEIVAVEESAATVTGFNYTIGTSTPADWAKVEKVNTFSISDDVNAYFNFVDSNKKDVTTNYSVVSSDSSVLLLPETKITGAIKLVAVKAGSVYINVLKDGKVVTSLPVVITEARKLVNFTLDASSVTVSNKVTTPVKVAVKAVDQTGKEIALKGITCTALGTTETFNAVQTSDKKAIEISSTAKAGTYTLKVEAEDNAGNKVTRTISVNVVDTGVVTADDAKDLRLVVDPAKINLAIADDATSTAKEIKVTVAAYEKGAKLGDVELTSVKFDGKDATLSADKKSCTISVADKKAGTYTVVVVAKDKTFTTNVTVENTQASATAKILKNVYNGVVADKDGVAAATMLSTAGIAEFYYNGKKLESTTVSVDNDQVKANGKQVYIGTVKVTVKNSKNTVYTVNAVVNTVFTVNVNN